MQVTVYRDASAFRGLVEAFLMEREAENNLMIGLLGAMASGGVTTRPVARNPLFFRISDSADFTVGAALLSPPNRLLLTSAPEQSLRLLAERLSDESIPDEARRFPGVLGPEPAARVFAEQWSARSGRRLRPGMKQRVFELTELVPAKGVSGELRVARVDELDFLTAWCIAFTTDAGADSGHERESIERLIRAGNLFVWECQGKPVSMTAWSGKTPTGARVSLVYTPNAERGKGYASACVSAVTARLLRSGLKRCFLYTDTTNPTSNRIYQKLGYQPVSDANIYEFSA